MKNTTILGILLAFILGLAGGCQVSQDRSLQVLQGAGYTDVKLGGRAWLRCSDDDTRARAFAAKGPSGQPVTGAVCCGMFAKNCTIRLN